MLSGFIHREFFRHSKWTVLLNHFILHQYAYFNKNPQFKVCVIMTNRLRIIFKTLFKLYNI